MGFQERDYYKSPIEDDEYYNNYENKKPLIKLFTRRISLQRFCTILIILLIAGICYEVCFSVIDPDSENIVNDIEISQPTALLSLQSFLLKDTTNKIKSDHLPNAEYAKSLSKNASEYNINLGGFILHTGNNNSKYVCNYYIINNTFIIIDPQTDEIYNLSKFCKSDDFPIAYRYVTLYPDVTSIPNYKIVKRTRDFDRLSPINDSEIINKISHIYSKKLNEHIIASEPESTVSQTLCTIPDDTQAPFITPTSIGTEKLTQESETEKIAQIIYEETNKERQNYGLHSLKIDVKLSEIALEHSADMGENGFFSHTNLRGEEPTDRALRHGYNVRKDCGTYYMYGIGENIGMMPTGNVIGIGYVNTIEQIGRAQVKSWMDSSGHRQNILSKEYDVIGIGVSYDGKYYISTQNFK